MCDGQGKVRVRGRQRVEPLGVAERVVLQGVQPGPVLPAAPGELRRGPPQLPPGALFGELSPEELLMQLQSGYIGCNTGNGMN